MFTGLAATALLTLTTGIALASTHTASHAPAARIDAAGPRVNNFWTYEDPNENPSGGDESYACVQGFDYLRSNGWIIQNPVKSVTNNCEFRVYLQYSDGHSDCVDPNTSRNVVDSINWFPDGVMIGNSTDNC